MRLAVVSDIHGNLVALEAVLADLRRYGCDAIVNLGDCVTGPLWPRETLELLHTLDLLTVRGNHDRWIASPPERPSRSIAYSCAALTTEERESLGRLPLSLRPVPDVLAVHGTPASDTEYLLEEPVDDRLALAPAAIIGHRLGDTQASLILCGHSHHQHMVMAPRDRLVLNPGSVGCPRWADDGDPRTAECGSPHARYAVATRRSGGWSVELFALAYDWRQVTRRARHNHRADFASAFADDASV